MGGGSRVVVDEFLAASAPEEAFTDAASLVGVRVDTTIPLRRIEPHKWIYI